MEFFETSAKTGQNVDDAYLYLAKECKKRLDSEGVTNKKPPTAVKIDNTNNTTSEKDKKGGCC